MRNLFFGKCEIHIWENAKSVFIWGGGTKLLDTRLLLAHPIMLRLRPLNLTIFRSS